MVTDSQPIRLTDNEGNVLVAMRSSVRAGLLIGCLQDRYQRRIVGAAIRLRNLNESVGDDVFTDSDGRFEVNLCVPRDRSTLISLEAQWGKHSLKSSRYL